jgi:hypothetical protein
MNVWPDFKQPRRTGVVWPWLLLVGAAIALGLSTWLGLGEQMRIAQLQTDLKLARDAAAMIAPRAAAPATGPANRAPMVLADRQAKEEGLRLVRWLQIDWPQRLAQVEAANSGARIGSALVLSSLRLDAVGGQVDIRGDVGQLADLDRLRDAWLEAGIPNVQITRHEAVERDGKNRHEFAAVLAWNGR